MGNSYIDYRKLRSMNDLRVQKEKLKYAVSLQEDNVEKSISALGNSFVNSLRTTMYKQGTRLVATALITILKSRFRKKSKD